MPMFVKFLRSLINCGRLTVIDADGTPHLFEGAPVEGLRPVTVRIHKKSLNWRVPLRPALTVGEAFMDGTLTVEDGGTIYDFLALAAENIHRANPQYSPGERWYAMLRRFQ